jgi:hypothetical protein
MLIIFEVLGELVEALLDRLERINFGIWQVFADFLGKLPDVGADIKNTFDIVIQKPSQTVGFLPVAVKIESGFLNQAAEWVGGHDCMIAQVVMVNKKSPVCPDDRRRLTKFSADHLSPGSGFHLLRAVRGLSLPRPEPW